MKRARKSGKTRTYHITIGGVKRLLRYGKEGEQIAKTQELRVRTDEIVNLDEAHA